MRPISCVAWSPNRMDLFGLGMDSQAFHKVWNGTVWEEPWVPLGGVFTSSIAVVSRGTNLLDLFGLGTDYSMFHKRWDGKTWSGWEGMGGVFASPPAVVSMAKDRIDVFGLATDHQLVHRWWDGKVWSGAFETLGGSFTSQPEVVSAGPNQLDVFGVGADFAMHHRSWTAAGWSPWESLGGTFTSQPAVVAWQADRVTTTTTASKDALPPGAKGAALDAQLTVFGLGTDSAMYYRTKRGGVWLGDWQSLGGVFVGPPAVVSWGPNRLDVFGVGTDAAMHHRSYAGGWDAGWTSLSGQFTSPPAVVARGPNKLDVFGLGGDYAMYHASGDGKSFAQWDRQGGEFETPGTYRFSLDSFEILDTRSVHNDTDSIAVSITVGGQPPQTLTMKTGDVNNGTHNVGLAFAPVNVDLSDFVIFNYLILNSGHADQKAIDDQLTGVAKTLSAKGVQAATEAIGKGLASLVGAVIGNAVLPVIGTGLGILAGWVVGGITGWVFADCDGPVAAEQAALTGVQLRTQTLGGGAITHEATHPGVKSNDGCGGNSLYKATWSYRPVHSR
jgi:hypothetical protein